MNYTSTVKYSRAKIKKMSVQYIRPASVISLFRCMVHCKSADYSCMCKIREVYQAS